MLPRTIEMQGFEASHYARFSVSAREAAEHAALPPEIVERVELVVEELVLNIASHGYRGQPGPLTMELCADETGIRIRLADQAAPFDPTAPASPDCSAPLSERAAGGLGVMLARSMSDGMSYRRDGGCNILEVSLKHRRHGR